VQGASKTFPFNVAGRFVGSTLLAAQATPSGSDPEPDFVLNVRAGSHFKPELELILRSAEPER